MVEGKIKVLQTNVWFVALIEYISFVLRVYVLCLFFWCLSGPWKVLVWFVILVSCVFINPARVQGSPEMSLLQSTFACETISIEMERKSWPLQQHWWVLRAWKRLVFYILFRNPHPSVVDANQLSEEANIEYCFSLYTIPLLYNAAFQRALELIVLHSYGGKLSHQR